MLIEPPVKGEPTRELWRKVAELTAVVNALQNMKVTATVPDLLDPTGNKTITGKLLITDRNAILILE